MSFALAYVSSICSESAFSLMSNVAQYPASWSTTLRYFRIFFMFCLISQKQIDFSWAWLIFLSASSSSVCCTDSSNVYTDTTWYTGCRSSTTLVRVLFRVILERAHGLFITNDLCLIICMPLGEMPIGGSSTLGRLIWNFGGLLFYINVKISLFIWWTK